MQITEEDRRIAAGIAEAHPLQGEKAQDHLAAPGRSQGPVQGPKGEAAELFGREYATAIFKDRKGHGGGQASYLQITQDSLAAITCAAFEIGAQWREDVEATQRLKAEAAGGQVVGQTIIAYGLTVKAGFPVIKLVERIADQLAENNDLRAQLTRAAEPGRDTLDAERYRWLRNPTLPVVILINGEMPFSVDAAIDAARGAA